MNLVQLIIESIGGQKAEADLQGVANATATVGEQSTNAVAGAAALGGAIGGMIGEMAGRIVEEFSEKLTELNDAVLLSGVHLAGEVEELHNLSLQSGVSINDLRAFRQVMSEAGLPTETLTFALTMLNRRLAEGKLKELVGDTQSSSEALLRLSEIVAKGGNAADVAFRAFGRGGIALIPVLHDLGARVEDVRSRMGDLSEETIASAEQWNTFTHHLETTTKSFLAGVGAEFLRWFSDVAEAAKLPDVALHEVTMKAVTGADQMNGIEVRAKANRPALSKEALERLDAATPGHEAARRLVAQYAELHQFPGDVERWWNAVVAAQVAGEKKIKEENKKAAEGLAAMMKRPEQEPGAGKEWYKHLIDMAAEQEKARKKALEEYRKTHEQLIQIAQDAARSIDGSFSTIWNDIGAGARQLTSDVEHLFTDLTKTVLEDLSKIALRMAEIGILNVVGSAFGAPGLGSIALGGGIGSVPHLGNQGGTRNVIIQTLDTRNLRMNMQLPGGSLARATQQMRIGATY